MGILLIAIALINVILFFIGSTAIPDVSTRRRGGSIGGLPTSKRYEWSIDYDFEASDGNIYKGTTTRRGSDMSINVEKKVYYLPINPRINSLASDVKPNFAQLIMLGLGALLIYVPFDRKNKKFNK